MKFRRLFSKTMYKNLKLSLGEMSFAKDFVQDHNGDMYPIIEKSVDCTEEISCNQYKVRGGSVERMFGAFFPYATYEVRFLPEEASACGFVFHLPECNGVTLLCNRREVMFLSEKKSIAKHLIADGFVTMIVTCRPGALEVYFTKYGKPEYFCTFETIALSDSHRQQVFEQSFVSFLCKGNVTVAEVSYYLDCGVSQADIKSIRYENGDVLYENGKVYLTVSLRYQEEWAQGVFSWIPGTAEFQLTGALFFDSGDGKWCGNVGASVLYHREEKLWYLWVPDFAHGHVLGHAVFQGDPRFGMNVIDIDTMQKATSADITCFKGFNGDEDPDFYYNAKEQKWYMSICRLDPKIKNYRYVFFESEKPFEGYRYIGQGMDGSETGGSFVTMDGEKVFVCGNDFNKRANYRIYTKAGMEEPEFDFDDGGFRGWGTILPIDMGSRKRYFWITFDRHLGSDYRWSYGNVYCFERI